MSFVVISLGAIALIWCLQLLRTRYRPHLRSIPGPFAASFTNIWKIIALYYDDMPGCNASVHKKYGPVVRIGPNHVSFSSPSAFRTIYTSRQAFPKSDFYEVGAPMYHDEPLENLFSLRDAKRHANLRRTIGVLHTKSAVEDFEPNIDRCVNEFLRQLGERTEHGPANLDMSLWLHLFAFDCQGEVNFSKQLGFLQRGQDVEDMIWSADKTFAMVGLLTQAPILQWVLKWLRSLSPAEKSEPALSFTLREVHDRTTSSKTHTDMLSRLLGVHDQYPDKVSVRDIIAAVFINMTAGHDTLATTLRAAWYYLAQNDHVLDRLRAEITSTESEYSASHPIPFAVISRLPFLHAIIQETLRIHPNTGTILERKVPRQGAEIDGYYVPGGTVVGVNAWILNYNKKIYGEDVHRFRPERWLHISEDKKLEMNRYLFSFGAGAHSCAGKNVATIMISKVMFEFYRKFDASLVHPDRKWQVRGSWVTKQTQIDMIISRRGMA